MLPLVMLWAEACNFAKTNTPPWVFFKCFELYKSREASNIFWGCHKTHFNGFHY